MTRLLALICALGLASGCAPAPSPAPPAEAAPALAPAADVVDRALASVVLVVATRDDGSVSYGSGIVLDGRGLVVTNAHVLSGSRSVRAMLYDPRRVSYTPMDGGLARYLFEYEKDLVAARVERVDTRSDLALLRVDADTSKLPRPHPAARPPRRGERVFAIGHPQENVWSFTAGQVSALHQGAVQHDALLSFGNSGGPLLNERGEIVGVNTSKVVSEPRGLSFARPFTLVEALVRAASDPSELDLSTPERAAKSCWLARELGSPSAEGCIDRGAAPHEAKTPGSDGPPGADHERRPSEPPMPAGATDCPTTPTPARQRAVNDVLGASSSATSQGATPAGSSAKMPPLRLGARVEEVRLLGDGLAWVRLETRTREGKALGVSELYARAGERWLRRTPPSPDERRALPSGWPSPRNDEASPGGTLPSGEARARGQGACT